ncbi:MAG: glycosyltransferase [Dorea sp.]|jgi:poly(glycerol-phosphate) alpha-glucosyltransferase|nr:glycosyltransferase [Dorea sp.]
MIYNFHHFYYWLKGGVETGQAYRAKIFRDLGLEAKFVFATTFPDQNIQHETAYLGFQDSEVIWMYGFFSDCKISPVTYTLEQLEKTFEERNYTFSRDGSTVTYHFPDLGVYYKVYMTDEKNEFVHRVVMVSGGCLIRKDYYTYCRIYSEYYAPVNGQASLYLRRFFNEDGSVAYEEIVEGDTAFYKFPDRMLYSREELLAQLMQGLNLTEDDVVLIDGEPGMIERAAFIQNAAPAKVGLIIHADHFWNYDEERVLWYGIYEYAFAHPEKISFFITNTDAQNNLLREQFQKYTGTVPDIRTIPVVGLDELKKPDRERRKHALISAGRLAPEKRMDQVIKAAAEAKKDIPDLSLDIYGEGRERENLQELIDTLGCGDCVRLCGFRKLGELYKEYDAYISASYVETLGVTLLEAVGSGLPVVSYDMRYGAQMFVDEGENGYKVPWENVEDLARSIVRLFTEADLEAFRKHSYEKAETCLTKEVAERWKTLLC